MDAMKKYFRVRQTINMWYGFYEIPNKYGIGHIPKKFVKVHFKEPKVPCLYRIEIQNRNKYGLRNRKEKTN